MKKDCNNCVHHTWTHLLDMDMDSPCYDCHPYGDTPEGWSFKNWEGSSMTVYLEAVEEKELYGTRLFIAGGITNCWDWQARSATALVESNVFDFVINPRRKEYDFDDQIQKLIQIKWEYEHLKESTHIMFWFTADTVQPISLFELGKSICSDKKIYIGCDPKYERQLDVVEQVGLSRPDIKIWNTLDELIESVISDNK